jgi:hypothetical protein
MRRNIPVIEKLAAANDHIETRYSADQHPELYRFNKTARVRSLF